jgi:hypothetical protein
LFMLYLFSIRYVAFESRQQALKGIAVAQSQVIRGVPIQAHLQTNSSPAPAQRGLMQPDHITPHSLPCNFSPTVRYGSHASAPLQIGNGNYVSGQPLHVQARPLQTQQVPIVASYPTYSIPQGHVVLGVPSGIHQQVPAQPIDYWQGSHQVDHPPPLYVDVDEQSYQRSMEPSYFYNDDETHTNHRSENYNHHWNKRHDERSNTYYSDDREGHYKSQQYHEQHFETLDNSGHYSRGRRTDNNAHLENGNLRRGECVTVANPAPNGQVKHRFNRNNASGGGGPGTSIQDIASNAGNDANSTGIKNNHAAKAKWKKKHTRQQIGGKKDEFPFLPGDRSHSKNEALASSVVLYADVVGKTVEANPGGAAKTSCKTGSKGKHGVDTVVQGLNKLSVS